MRALFVTQNPSFTSALAELVRAAGYEVDVGDQKALLQGEITSEPHDLLVADMEFFRERGISADFPTPRERDWNLNFEIAIVDDPAEISQALKFGADDVYVRDTILEIFDERFAITDHRIKIGKRLIDEHRADHTRLQRITEMMPQVVNIVDVKTMEMRFWNRPPQEVLNYPNDLPQEEFLARADHPDNEAILSERRERMSRATDDEVVGIVLRYRDADGHWRWFEERCKVFSRDDDGSVREVLRIIDDVSEKVEREGELKDARDQLGSILDSMEEFVWAATPGFDKALYVSPSVESIFGVPTAEVIENLGILRTHNHPDDEDKLERARQEMLREGSSECTYRIIRRDGGVRTVRVRGQLVKDEAGEVTRVDGVMQDITRQAELEAQLRNAQRMEALGTMAGGIAHDFNNILTPILFHAEHLTNFSSLGEKERERVASILSNALRAKNAIKSILRIGRSAEPVPEATVEVAPLLTEVIDLAREITPNHIEFDVDVDPDLTVIKGDRDQLQQALLNIIANSCHAIGKDTGKVSIRGRNHSSNIGETQVKIDVSDNGCGIDAEHLDLVFDPFFTTKEPGEGTGLGLAMAHGIVRAHGGSLEIASERGVGTTLTMTLPASAEEAAPKKDSAKIRVVKGATPKSSRVMVVDDEPMVGMVMQDMVEQLGYECDYCESAKDAFDSVSSGDQYDLILSDFSMPGMTGLDLARELEKRAPDTPIILITGWSFDLEDEIRSQPNVIKILDKPVSMSEFAKAIEDLLANGQLRE